MKKSNSKEIRQHNVITTARYEMSACEMDLVFCLLSKIHPNNGNKYEISVMEIEKITGRQWNYQQLKEATEKLGSRVYEIDTETRFTQMWMLAAATYIKGSGIIELELSDKIKPYLLDLKEKFTSYRLQAVLNLNSKYAKRIYQLASQWKTTGQAHYTIEELKYMLYLKDPKGKEPEQYKQIGQLKDKVLDVSKTQINEHTELKIDYELHKRGRSFHSITFYVTSQKPKTKPLNFQSDDKTQKAIEVARELGITREDILQEIAESEEIQRMLRKYVNEIKLDNHKDVKNKAGYFITMMRKQKEK